MDTITRSIPSAIVGRSSLTQAQKMQVVRVYLTARARTNPVAARLLLEFGPQLGKVAA